MLKFDAGIFRGELPIGLGVVGIAVVLPGGDFVDEGLLVGDAAVEALSGEDTELGFRQIEPATARSGARSKKHSSTPSPPALGHPAEGQQRVRSRHGRRAGRLHAATRRQLSAGLPGRDLEATYRRNTPADPDESRTPGPFRL